MTLIVGIEHEGGVYLGADSGNWRGDGLESSNATPKLCQVGPLLVGLCGAQRLNNLVRYGIGDLPAARGDAERYLVLEFIPRLRDALLAAGAMGKDQEGRDSADGAMLVACGGMVFTISNEMCVARNTFGYAATGHPTAIAIALGVLACTARREPEERIRQALEVAEDHCDAVRGPYVFERQAAVSREVRTA